LDCTWLCARPFAHRGYHSLSEGRPENSLPAFAAACSKGYGIETDAQLTSDGRVAMIHDADLARLTGAHLRVGETDSQALSTLRLQSTQHQIPLLEDLLALVAGQVPLMIECKNGGIGGRLEAAVVDAMRFYSGEFVLQSFNPISVWRLKHARLPCLVGQISGRLLHAPAGYRLVGRSLALNALTRPDFICCELESLPSRAADFWRRRGLPVIAWTVHSRAEEERALRIADNYVFASYEPSTAPGSRV
jgi:glycerophosphoryl diester phosphodiesterase